MDVSRRGFVGLSAAAGVSAVIASTGQPKAGEHLASAEQRANELVSALTRSLPADWIVEFCPEDGFVLIHRRGG